MVGTLSYADFVFYELLNYYKHIFPASITETLAAYILRFENLHGVKEIIAKNEGILTVFMPKGHAIWSGPSAWYLYKYTQFTHVSLKLIWENFFLKYLLLIHDNLEFYMIHHEFG